ncbi:kinase-like protein, partial [Clavulina sp. PMI_390]
ILHSQLHHPNVLPFLGVYHERDSPLPLIVLPFLEHGSLEKLLANQKPDGLIEQADLVRIVTRGLVYLHSRDPPIIHGDIHPGNILLDEFNNPILCDFGFGRICHEVARSQTKHEDGGRLRFIAPELWDTPGSSQKSDIFAIAMTYLNAWSGQPPFHQIRPDWKVASRLNDGLRPTRPITAVELGTRARDGLWELLMAMWAHETSSRPSSDQVLDSLEHIFRSCRLLVLYEWFKQLG